MGAISHAHPVRYGEAETKMFHVKHFRVVFVLGGLSAKLGLSVLRDESSALLTISWLNPSQLVGDNR